MSQAGLVDLEGSHPQIPTSFVTNSGTAIAVGNVIEILGSGAATTSGSGNTITVTVAASSFTWTDEATSFNAVATNGYFVTATATATLPTATQGQTIIFVVDVAPGTGLLTIQAATGQFIRIGKAISASAGVAVNNFQGDSVTLVYRAADTTWIATSPIGTWTVT